MKKSYLTLVTAMMVLFLLSGCKQDAPEYPREFTVSPALDEIVFDAAYPQTYEFTVSGNVEDWIVETSDEDWCIIASHENGFSVTAKPTISDQKRSGTLTVRSKTMAAKPVVMDVHQNELKIFIAGKKDSRATYWTKNEEVRILDTGSYLNAIYATRDGRVSTVGKEGNTLSKGFYWDENVGVKYRNTREDSTGDVSGVWVDEDTGDIYISEDEGWTMEDGSFTAVVRYSKNFVSTDLTEEGKQSMASNIMYKDGNLYIYVRDGRVNHYYLKNDEKIMLEAYSHDIYPYGKMAVRGDDLYLAGFYLHDGTYSPCYWKNGKITPIPTDVDARSTGIAVDDNGNVFIAGYYVSDSSLLPAYWKNGEMTILSEKGGLLVSIDIIDGNIVCTGMLYNDQSNRMATYWINGVPHSVSDGNEYLWIYAGFVR